jgi:hypothetical protein
MSAELYPPDFGKRSQGPIQGEFHRPAWSCFRQRENLCFSNLNASFALHKSAAFNETPGISLVCVRSVFELLCRLGLAGGVSFFCGAFEL